MKSKTPSLSKKGGLPKLEILLERLNLLVLHISMVALVIVSCILTYSVISRYLFNVPTDWQDEISVFILVGSIFFCSAYVQSVRGHVGIEILGSVLSPKWNAVRLFFVDLSSMIFCAFFSWKSWTLTHEVIKEGAVTPTVLGAPLWIPYSCMALGMSLLTLQLLFQTIHRFYKARGK